MHWICFYTHYIILWRNFYYNFATIKQYKLTQIYRVLLIGRGKKSNDLNIFPDIFGFLGFLLFVHIYFHITWSISLKFSVEIFDWNYIEGKD